MPRREISGNPVRRGPRCWSPISRPRPARKLAHARILLKADAAEGGPPGPTTGSPTPWRSAPPPSSGSASGSSSRASTPPWSTQDRKTPSRRKLDGGPEARLIALACSRAAGGPRRWTMQLLADKLVELEVVETHLRRDGPADSEKNELKPRLKEQWCIPPEANAEFVWRHGGRAGGLPPALRREAAAGLPGRGEQAAARRGRRADRRPRRASPSGSTTSTSATARPTCSWSRAAAGLAQRPGDRAADGGGLRRGGPLAGRGVHEEAEKVVLVMDNLNTHKPASLYEAFPPERGPADRREAGDPLHAQARQLAEHGGDRASVLGRQCLDRRIETRETLEREVAAWEADRNARARPSTGASPRRMPGSSSSISIPRSWRSHRITQTLRDGTLVPWRPQKSIDKPVSSSGEKRQVRLVPPGVARVGISVGIKATALRMGHIIVRRFQPALLRRGRALPWPPRAHPCSSPLAHQAPCPGRIP